jgi:hypothetical protein
MSARQSIYADSDWAADKSDRKSITGWIAQVNGDPISWASKKQTSTSLSTCEAELYAEAAAMQEALWINGLLKELGIGGRKPAIIYGDNQATQSHTKNGIRSERTKHIDIRYYFITDLVERGVMDLRYVRSEENQADILTKALGLQVFDRLRKMILTRVEQ